MVTERPTLEQLVQRSRTLNGVYQGTYWRHNRSDGVYVINAVDIRESDYSAWVSYSPVDCPALRWHRQLESDFLEEVGGVPRFSRVFPKVTYER